MCYNSWSVERSQLATLISNKICLIHGWTKKSSPVYNFAAKITKVCDIWLCLFHLNTIKLQSCSNKIKDLWTFIVHPWSTDQGYPFWSKRGQYIVWLDPFRTGFWKSQDTHGFWWFVIDHSNQGAGSLLRCHLTSIGNPIVEIRRSYDRLISTMGFPILVRQHLYIETGPWRTPHKPGNPQTDGDYDNNPQARKVHGLKMASISWNEAQAAVSSITPLDSTQMALDLSQGEIGCSLMATIHIKFLGPALSLYPSVK